LSLPAVKQVAGASIQGCRDNKTAGIPLKTGELAYGDGVSCDTRRRRHLWQIALQAH
jgi:hypothetical protein